MSINKVLLEHGLAGLFTFCLWPFLTAMAEELVAETEWATKTSAEAAKLLGCY